jgi:hypothetical protein
MACLVELIGDLLGLAEKKLGVPAERLLRTAPLSGLESMLAAFEEEESELSPAERAALCGAWIIRHQPFPQCNREMGYAFMRLKLKQAELPWPQAQECAHQIEARLQELETGAISEAKFVEWVCLRVAAA